MAAIDFPASPTDGQLFAAPNGVLYQYDSTKGLWLTAATTTSVRPGNFFATTGNNLSTVANTVILFGVVNGNEGGWYNASNGRFTPPAGRYYIFAHSNGYSSAGVFGITMNIRKNGVSVIPSAGNNFSASGYANADAYGVVDASGTDYFDVVAWAGAAQTGGTGHWFGAVPVGTVVAMPAPGDGVERLVSEQVLSVAASIIDVAVPTNAKKIRLEWMTANVGGTDKQTILGCKLAGATVGGATHGVQLQYSNGTTNAGAVNASLGAFGFQIVAHTHASLSIARNLAGAPYGTGTMFNMTGVGSVYQSSVAFTNSAITAFDGMYLANSGGTPNFQAGSWLRCYAVT